MRRSYWLIMASNPAIHDYLDDIQEVLEDPSLDHVVKAFDPSIDIVPGAATNADWLENKRNEKVEESANTVWRRKQSKQEGTYPSDNPELLELPPGRPRRKSSARKQQKDDDETSHERKKSSGKSGPRASLDENRNYEESEKKVRISNVYC